MFASSSVLPCASASASASSSSSLYCKPATREVFFFISFQFGIGKFEILELLALEPGVSAGICAFPFCESDAPGVGGGTKPSKMPLSVLIRGIFPFVLDATGRINLVDDWYLCLTVEVGELRINKRKSRV